MKHLWSTQSLPTLLMEFVSPSNLIKRVTPQIRKGIVHETTIQYEKHVKDFYIFYHSFLSSK
jgi:hypothetical protein